MTTQSEHPLATLPDTSNANKAKSTQPEARILDHEYDGIREYDNPLPRWWVWMWAGSFFFSVGYFFHYHVSHNGTSVADGYLQDMAEARVTSFVAHLDSLHVVCVVGYLDKQIVRNGFCERWQADFAVELVE